MTGLLASALFLTQTVLKGGRRLKGVVIARGSKIGIDAGAEDRHDGMIRGEVQCREDHVLSEVTLACIVSLLLTCFHQARVEHYPVLEVCVALGRYVCYSHRLRF